MLNPQPIYDITPFSLLDYPQYPSAIIWFAGCNMRCQYCYNPDIVFSKGSKSIEEALKFLQTRVGLLEGVVLSGGEATQYQGLEAFCSSVKELGYKIKLDTNGTNPLLIQKLLRAKLIDFIALDYKAPPHKFYTITKSRAFKEFENTLELLLTCKADFEVRTTLHNDLLNIDDINLIINNLVQSGYTNTYYIQEFKTGVKTINNLPKSLKSFTTDKLSKALHVRVRQT